MATAAPLACEADGLCSMERLAPFTGDIAPAPGLAGALQARSFNKEVILMTTDVGRMDFTLQALASINVLGFGHVLLMSWDEAACTQVAQMSPDTGCAWLGSAGMVPPLADNSILRLLHAKQIVMLRAVRLAYNVLACDAEVLWFRSPYTYLKQAPLNKAALVMHSSTPVERADSLVSPHTGFMYVQGARPDGPATWVLAETYRRLARLHDDDFNKASMKHTKPDCLLVDQDAMLEAINSAACGKMVSLAAVHSCMETQTTYTERKYFVLEAVVDIAGWWKWGDADVPGEWQQLVGGSKMGFKWGALQVPNAREWDLQWGSRWWPTEKGRYSKAFMDTLAADGPSIPLWPDAEDASLADAASDIPTEVLAITPPWLSFGGRALAMTGVMHPAMTGRPLQQVVYHMWHMPYVIEEGNELVSGLNQQVPMMALRRWSWQLLRIHHPRMSGYWSCRSEPAFCLDELRVLGYTPQAVDALGRLATMEEYMAALWGLAAMAVLTKRIMLWPDVDCRHAAWIRNNASALPERPPLELHSTMLPYDNWRCAWLPATMVPCLLDGRGMLTLEFREWVQRMRDRGHMIDAWPGHNVLHFVTRARHTAPPPPPPGPQPLSLQQAMLAVDAEALLAHLTGPDALVSREVLSRPMLFVDHLVHVLLPPESEAAQALEGRRDCPALSDLQGERVQALLSSQHLRQGVLARQLAVGSMAAGHPGR